MSLPDAHTSPTDSRRVTVPSCRSRATNGSVLVAGIDGRSRQARRLRDLYRGFLAQTDGRNEAIVRSLASLCLQREELDSRLARGESVDVDHLLRLAGEVRRTMSRLGIVASEPVVPVDAPPWVVRP